MPNPNRVAKPAQPSLESLETRRLLSASLSHGLLTVDGTRRADEITVGLVSPRTLRVTVNGQESLFARKAVERIRVRAGTGDDSVLFLSDATYPTPLRLLVSAGAGNDSLYGGDNADTLLGEDGNDFFEGWGGDDVIRGGAGNDTLRGCDGDDRLFGESGDDDLRGMTGDDTLFGGRGADTLHEDAGRDRVLGGDDLDLFYFSDSPKDVPDESRREAIDPEPVVSMPILIPGEAVANPITFQGVTIIHQNAAYLTTSIGGAITPPAYNWGSGYTGITKSGSGGVAISGGSVSGGLHLYSSPTPVDLSGLIAGNHSTHAGLSGQTYPFVTIAR